MLTHASLFSGIGGFDLAAEWAGWENIFHCEWNPFGQKVLAHHFPNSKSYNDITKTDFTIHEGTVDVLTGGFPCQPYSVAGKRLGKADERHLFPEMLRAIKEIKPKWIIGENVRGLVSWNGGLVFDEVCADLEGEGYEVQPFLIPAASVNAPHRRDRIWFVAYANDKGRTTRLGQVQGENGEVPEWYDNAGPCDASLFNASNTECVRLQYSKKTRNIFSSKEKARKQGSKLTEPIETNGNYGDATNSFCERGQLQTSGEYTSKQMFGSNGTKRSIGEWQKFPTVSPVCNGNDGVSDRLDSITFSKWRNESIKAGGNAIVPQVAFEIFKAINEFELLVNK